MGGSSTEFRPWSSFLKGSCSLKQSLWQLASRRTQKQWLGGVHFLVNSRNSHLGAQLLFLFLHLFEKLEILVEIKFYFSWSIFSRCSKKSSVFIFCFQPWNIVVSEKINFPGHCQNICIDHIEISFILFSGNLTIIFSSLSWRTFVFSPVRYDAFGKELELFRTEFFLTFLENLSKQLMLFTFGLLLSS